MDEALRQILATDTRLHTHRRRVRFQDADAAGIVFFVRTFDYFHDAYVDFLRSRGAPLEEAIASGSWIAPIRRAEAEYLRPMRFAEEIEVSIVAVRLEATEYTIGYRIDRDGQTTCVGRTRHVSVDPETFERAAVPEKLRGALGG